MRPSDLQKKWLADFLAIDLRQDPSARGGKGAAPAAPAAHVDGEPGPSSKTSPQSGAPKPAGGASRAASHKVEITIRNETDQSLRLVKATSDGGRFEPAPPTEIAPGATVTLAASGTGPKGGSIIYQVEPKGGVTDKPEELPWWTLSWKQPAGKQPEPGAELDPAVKGWTSAAAAGKSSLAFVLSGAATGVAPTQPQAPAQQKGPEQRTSVTLSNQSDVVLRYAGADRTTARFDRQPPKEIKPGQSFTLVTTSSGDTHAGLLYTIVPGQGQGSPQDAKQPMWVFHWRTAPGQPLTAGTNTVPTTLPDLRAAFSLGKEAVTFELSGKWNAAAAPAQQKGPEQRTSVTLSNQSDVVLRYAGADRTTARFDRQPPKEIKPGQSFSLVTTSSGDTHAGLLYTIVPVQGSPQDAKEPMWVFHWRTAPGQPLTAGTNTVPTTLPDLRAASSIGKEAVTFELSGKWNSAAAPAQPKASEQRTSVTLVNKSNVVLRYAGADRTTAQFDRKPPKEIKPGQNFTFVTTSSGDTHAGLIYTIVPGQGSPQDAKERMWVFHWRTAPGQPLTAGTNTVPTMTVLDAALDVGKDAVTFELSGQWSPGLEYKTPVTISNETRFTLRLTASTASAGRFDPAAPKEIAPGGKAAFATWAKEKSTQKVVYELQSAGGASKSKAKPKLWTMTWNTTPGEPPGSTSTFENFTPSGSSTGREGRDGVGFEISIADDADE